MNQEFHYVNVAFKGGDVKWSLAKLVKIVDYRWISEDQLLHFRSGATLGGIMNAG